jgi:hypothetical protein
MKILLRLLLVFVVLIALLLGASFFLLTRPGIQKILIEGQLPEGSSLRTVRVTTSSLELSGLKLSLPDGSRIRLEALDTEFDPLAALFDRSLRVGALNVEGLIVEVPEPIFAGTAPAPSPASTGASTPARVPTAGAEPRPLSLPTAPAGAGSPLDALYAIGQLDWLIDIDSIRLSGELRDGGGSTFGLELSSSPIRPGEEASLEAKLRLASSDALHAGLQTFEATARLFLNQLETGGFDSIRLESVSNAADASGNSLLAARQQLELGLEGFDERAEVEVGFDLDLPRPEIVLPELKELGALTAKGSFLVKGAGRVLTVEEADLSMASNGASVLQADLKQSLSLGGQQSFTGDLMGLRLTGLPLAWFAPWMPSGSRLYGGDISADLALSGHTDGGIELRALAPIRVGPVSLDSDSSPILDQVTLSFEPTVRIAGDQPISWELGELKIEDRFGTLVTGASSGTFDPDAAGDGLIPAGLNARAQLNLGLPEISQQPFLAGRSSIGAGQATVRVDIDSKTSDPVQIEGKVLGLSSRTSLGQRADYRFTMGLSEPQSGNLQLVARLDAGPKNRPSSDLQFIGQISPETAPLRLKGELDAPRLNQRDLELLRAAFAPQQSISAASPSRGGGAPSASATPGPSSAIEPSAHRPLWAAYDAEVRASVAELTLISGEVVSDILFEAVATEPLLAIKQIKASVDGGQLEGSGELRYSKRKEMAYAVEADLEFENIDPAMLSKQRSGAFPVRGLFNGNAQIAGNGVTLEAAVDDLEGELLVTGREGVLTAFELDSRSQLGLIGAGLLGERFNRPGIAAVAEAVPYFQDIRFSDFSLRLQRGNDKRIMIPELRFQGDHLLLNGSGLIAATSLTQILDQPLDLSLELGARGPLVDSLETLQLLGPNTSEDGYRRWNRVIDIGGTLGRPDTGALRRILNEAAQRALTTSEPKPKTAETSGGEPSQSDKDRKAQEAIQTGAEIIHLLLNKQR